MEDTDILWERICARHCKGVKRQEMETWREMYLVIFIIKIKISNICIMYNIPFLNLEMCRRKRRTT